ncbi:MAG: beta-ketoacyl-[acyl-carrier-protein] synthase family protein [Panacagrimonas sp.]
MSPRPRVLITGAGVVSPLASGYPAFTDALMSGASAVKAHNIGVPGGDQKASFWGAWFGPEYQSEVAGHGVQPFMDRSTHFALDAADEAIKRSGLLQRPSLDRGRGVIVCGIGLSGQVTMSQLFFSIYGQGKKRAHPFTVPKLMPSGANSIIAMQYGLSAPGFSVSSACASSNHAVGIALGMLRSGICDWAIVGGAEAGIGYVSLLSWQSLRVTSPSHSAPFSEGPTGMAIGEGAAMVVLETEAHAQAGGAKPLAELAGFGMSSDGDHMTQMNPAVAGRAIELALADAGISAAEVDHINAHGTGTQLNDRSESEVIHRVYGEHARRIPVTSTKAAHGHAIGATSALELIAGVASLQQQQIPPTANFTRLREGVDLNVVHGQAQQAALSNVVSHAFGFGGLNAVLALRGLR